MALQGKDKQIIELSHELAKKLKDQEFKQAWTMAGELSSLLKNDEELQLPYQVIECIKRDLNSYYDMNKQLFPKIVILTYIRKLVIYNLNTHFFSFQIKKEAIFDFLHSFT